MKILLDIDVILDILEEREEFYLDSFSVLNLCALGRIEGWISADSLSTVYCFLRKISDEGRSREKIIHNLRPLGVIPIRRGTLEHAFRSELPDFEANINIASAETFHLDFIVTRNIVHYKKSPIKALTPKEFIAEAKSGLLSKKPGNVPFLDLKAQHHQLYNEIDDRITDIIGNTGFVLGKHVAEFEERFAEAQGAKYCVGVSSGTDALHVALLALGIKPGDRLIVPVNTFIATAEALSLCGAEPVFVDCDEFCNIDVQKLRERLSAINHESSALPKAVIPVHLYGQPANMDKIMVLANEYGLKVVEDCCQAHLARYRKSDGRWQSVGTTGEFGAFSFYPGKNLGAYGEAGALITNDEALYKRAKMFRQHGEIERYRHQLIGHNYRMEAIQGAVLSTKIKYLKEWTEKRQQNARLYSALLEGVDGVETPEELEGTECVYHLYVIRTDDRDGLMKHLGDNNIASGLHYPIPLHLQEAYGFLGHKEGDFPCAESTAKRILSLPMYPELTENQVRYVVEKIKEFARLSH